MRIMTENGVMEIFDINLENVNVIDNVPQFLHITAKFFRTVEYGEVRCVNEPIAYFKIDKDEDKLSRALKTFDEICGDLLETGTCKMFEYYTNCHSMKI
jgi:hypothetical protein